jgi:hypothetical protein
MALWLHGPLRGVDTAHWPRWPGCCEGWGHRATRGRDGLQERFRLGPLDEGTGQLLCPTRRPTLDCLERHSRHLKLIPPPARRRGLRQRWSSAEPTLAVPGVRRSPPRRNHAYCRLRALRGAWRRRRGSRRSRWRGRRQSQRRWGRPGTGAGSGWPIRPWRTSPKERRGGGEARSRLQGALLPLAPVRTVYWLAEVLAVLVSAVPLDAFGERSRPEALERASRIIGPGSSVGWPAR